MNKILLLFLSINLLSLHSKGQDYAIFKNKNGNKTWVGKSLFQDHGKIWSSPFRMQKRDLKYVVPIISLAGLSIIYDEEIYREFKSFQSKSNFIDKFSPIITYMGDDKTSLSVSTLFLTTGLLSKNDRATQTALMGYQTFVHVGIVIQVMKHLAGRQRPSVDDGKDFWHGPLAAFERYDNGFSRYDAFPSGHTIVAWGMATVIAKQYQNHIWVPYTMYTLATAAGLSRVTEDTHWLSDVIVGGSLGYAIGNFIHKSHEKTNWTLFPKFNGDNKEMSLMIRF